MPDALGVCGTMCKVKKEENIFLGDLQLPSQIARTRVRLLYTEIIENRLGFKHLHQCVKQ